MKNTPDIALVRRALAAFWATAAGEVTREVSSPVEGSSAVQEAEGLRYVTLRDVEGRVVQIYRVRQGGALKLSRRPPKSLIEGAR